METQPVTSTPQSTIGMPPGIDQQFRQSDVYIAVMGVTGAGKSTFISKCCSAAASATSDGMKSCTQNVQMYTFTHNGKVIHLIDTPGFDDTYRTDSDVLRDLAYYLTASYGNGYRLTGIIYLHPITHNRLGGTAFKNLRTFRKLCGTQSMSAVVLATTMWSDVSPDVGDARERELEQTAEFWGDMIRENSKVLRHTNDYNSAMNIISYLTDRNTTTVLEIQSEMVDRNRSLEDTEAGREVDSELRKQREAFEQRLASTKQDLEDAIASKDEEHVQAIIREQEKFESKLAAIQKGREELRISMEALIADKEKKHREEMDRMSQQLTNSQAETKKQADKWKKYIAAAEMQRKKDEAERRKREEELAVAKAQVLNADIDKIRIVLGAAEFIQQEQEAKERHEEWNRRESQLKSAINEQSRLADELRENRRQLAQSQQWISMQQAAMNINLHRAASYQPAPPPYQHCQYNYPSGAPPPPSYDNASSSAAVGTGVGLATGATLTGMAMMGGCSIM